MPFAKKYMKRKAKKYAKKYAKKSVTKSKKALTKFVKNVIRKDAETKYVMEAPLNVGGGSLNSFTGFSSAITSSNEVYKILPTIQIGSNSHTREGDIITPLSCTFKGRVCLNARSLTSCGVYVYMYILTSKQCKSWNNAKLVAQAIPTSRLLDDGQGNKVQFIGQAYNAMYKVNTDEFNIIKVLRFHLTKGAGNYNALGSVGASNESASPYTPGENTKDFSVRIPLPAKLQYSSSTVAVTTDPVNSLPFMVCGWCWDDNFGNDASNTTTLVNIQAQTHLYFQDPQ